MGGAKTEAETERELSMTSRTPSLAFESSNCSTNAHVTHLSTRCTHRTCRCSWDFQPAVRRALSHQLCGPKSQVPLCACQQTCNDCHMRVSEPDLSADGEHDNRTWIQSALASRPQHYSAPGWQATSIVTQHPRVQDTLIKMLNRPSGFYGFAAAIKKASSS